MEVPVPLTPEIHGPLISIHHGWDVIISTGLKEEHAHISVLSQTASDDRSGWPDPQTMKSIVLSGRP